MSKIIWETTSSFGYEAPINLTAFFFLSMLNSLCYVLAQCRYKFKPYIYIVHGPLCHQEIKVCSWPLHLS